VNALQVNPQTGFLESRSAYHNSFDSDKKVKVIELVNQFAQEGKWPRLSVIAKAADVGAQTIRDHLASDPEFKSAFEEAMVPVEDNLVDNLWAQGKNANGITANIFLLKSRWPDRWGDKSSTLSVDVGALKELSRRAEGFIDAEVVDSPQKSISSGVDTTPGGKNEI